MGLRTHCRVFRNGLTRIEECNRYLVLFRTCHQLICGFKSGSVRCRTCWTFKTGAYCIIYAFSDTQYRTDISNSASRSIRCRSGRRPFLLRRFASTAHHEPCIRFFRPRFFPACSKCTPRASPAAKRVVRLGCGFHAPATLCEFIVTRAGCSNQLCTKIVDAPFTTYYTFYLSFILY